MEFYWLFCRHTTLFDLLPPIIGFFRFGKLWSSFDMGVKARINAPRLPDQYSHRHFIFALNRYVGANSRNAKTYKDLCDRRRRTSFKGKTLDRCLRRQKVELSRETRRKKTSMQRKASVQIGACIGKRSSFPKKCGERKQTRAAANLHWKTRTSKRRRGEKTNNKDVGTSCVTSIKRISW